MSPGKINLGCLLWVPSLLRRHCRWILSTCYSTLHGWCSDHNGGWIPSEKWLLEGYIWGIKFRTRRWAVENFIKMQLNCGKNHKIILSLFFSIIDQKFWRPIQCALFLFSDSLFLEIENLNHLLKLGVISALNSSKSISCWISTLLRSLSSFWNLPMWTTKMLGKKQILFDIVHNCERQYWHLFSICSS